jgi:hypothetical protein
MQVEIPHDDKTIGIRETEEQGMRTRRESKVCQSKWKRTDEFVAQGDPEVA